MKNVFRIDMSIGNQPHREIGTFEIDEEDHRFALNDITIMSNAGINFSAPVEIRITRIH